MTDRVIRVVMDSKGVETGAKKAEKAITGVDKSTKGLSRTFSAAAKAAGALAGAFSIRELIQTADAYTGIQNRLRLVTDSTEELADANARLFDIAQAARQPLEGTAQLFSRAAASADELGASQDQLFRLTEITSKGLAIQGGAASESAGALRQLGQALSQETVRAEEFNSILDGALPIAQAAARGLDEAGGSVGRLRQLVIDGKVSSKEFFDAILEGGGEIDEQFAKTVPSVGQAITVLQNSFLSFVGELNEASGASASLAELIIDLSEYMTLFGRALTGTLGPEDEMTAGLETISIAALIVVETFSSLFDALSIVKGAFIDTGEAIGGVAAAITLAAQGEFSAAKDVISDLGFDDTTTAIEEFAVDFGAGIDSVADKINKVLTPSLREVRTVTDEIKNAPEFVPPPARPEKKTKAKKESFTSFSDAAKASEEFVEALRNQETELRLTAELGDEAGEAITRFQEDLAIASAEARIFAKTQPTAEIEKLKDSFRSFAEESIENQRKLREEIEASDLRETFDEQIEALEEEISLLGADNEALAKNAAARALAAGATAEQAQRIEELTLTLDNERDALNREKDTLEDFFADVGQSAKQSLTGILADPMGEGLDELPFKFAETLQQMAAEALTSELFSLIAGMFTAGAGGAEGGTGSIFTSLAGAFFGGGKAAGGSVMGGRPIMIGERGPEIWEPPGSGNIVPNVNVNMAAQAPPAVNVYNITDPADIPSGLRTTEGEEAVVNIIQRNPEAIRRILG